MIKILILWIIAPVSIFLGLVVFNNVALTFLVFHGFICLCIPIVDLLIIQKKGIRNYLEFIGLKNIKKTILPAIVVGLIFCFSIVAFFVLLEKYVINLDQMQNILDSWNVNNKYIIPLLIIMIFANSVVEEIYWRGYIYKKLEAVTSSFKVVVYSSLFYASYHLITTVSLFYIVYGILFTTLVFGVGFFWGYMRRKFDSIYFSIISHLLADLGIMVIYVKYFF